MPHITGAESGSRTRTSLRTSVFETDASAYSATSALWGGGTTIPLAGATDAGPGPDLDPERLRAHADAFGGSHPRWHGRGQRLRPAHLSAARDPAYPPRHEPSRFRLR